MANVQSPPGGKSKRFKRAATDSKPAAKYSARSLIWNGIRQKPWPRVWKEHELKDRYDVVIIGAGVHGLATAYYLAKDHGITNVAVLDKGYLGGGGSGRNTAIVRSNYLTPEGVAFYDRSLELYNSMAQDLNINVMFSERGHMTLAHSDAALRTMRGGPRSTSCRTSTRASSTPTRSRSWPRVSTSPRTRYPILGALSTRRAASSATTPSSGGTPGRGSRGVEMHQKTEVLDILCRRRQGPTARARAARSPVFAPPGDISRPDRGQLHRGWATLISDMAGVKLPITTHPLQAAVTEPVKVFLPAVVVSGRCTSTSARPTVASWFSAPRSTRSPYYQCGFARLHRGAGRPRSRADAGISRMRLLRQWAGLCDMTPDYSPVMGFTPVNGFFCDVGWGTYGFKAGPVSGEQMAACIATQETPDLIAAFALSRFEAGTLVGEKGAAAVGH